VEWLLLACCKRQQFQPVFVVVIPPRVMGELPGFTPKIQLTSVVVSPSPELIARSAASSRARKVAVSPESADGADAAIGPVCRVWRVG
jgi:hypothetical protein